MVQYQELKAGPSQQSSRLKGTWLKTASVIVLLLLGYWTFVYDRQSGAFVFQSASNAAGNNRGQNLSSKGSQYLLGVGKADITGYCFLAFE
jgi:hypothetical protein